MDKITSILMSIYALVAVVSSIYFNWNYVVTEGFWKWLMFGEVIATFKGLLWPFFLF